MPGTLPVKKRIYERSEILNFTKKCVVALSRPLHFSIRKGIIPNGYEERDINAILPRRKFAQESAAKYE